MKEELKSEITYIAEKCERLEKVANRITNLKPYIDRQIEGLKAYKSVLEGILEDLEK